MTSTNPGRVAVAVYVCTSESDTAELLADYCENYAAAREWDVAETVLDTDRRQPCASRPGWSKVADLLDQGRARGVVVYSRAMIADGEPEYEAVRGAVRDASAFMVVIRLDATSRPRRTGTALARHHVLADHAAGWDTP